MSRIRDRGPDNIRGPSLLVRQAVAGLLLMAGASGISPALAQDTGAAIAVHGTARGAPPCIACHGARGEGNAANGFPRLAGLPASYLRAQMSAFADGQRENPVMAPIAKILSADEAQAVSLYFAGLPAPDLPNSAPVSPAPAPFWRSMDASPPSFRLALPVTAPAGSGSAPAFRRSQASPPLTSRLSSRHGSRASARPARLGLMQAVARRLSPSDISAVSRWFAAQPAGGGR